MEKRTRKRNKERTILVNMRIPESLLREFDEVVDEDVLVPSRTAKIISLMHAHIKNAKRKRS
jgi:metal-responsive CopG/Arc/MetJ family transcriptional regulator